MIKDAIATLADRGSLTEPEAEAVMIEIMEGQRLRLKLRPI